MIFLENLVILEIINLDVAERILWRNNLYEKNVKKNRFNFCNEVYIVLESMYFLSFTHVCDAAYVWVCVCVYVCTFLCMNVCVFRDVLYVSVCEYLCECFCTYIYSYMWRYTYIHTLFEPYLKFNRIEGAIVHSHN